MRHTLNRLSHQVSTYFAGLSRPSCLLRFRLAFALIPPQVRQGFYLPVSISPTIPIHGHFTGWDLMTLSSLLSLLSLVLSLFKLLTSNFIKVGWAPVGVWGSARRPACDVRWGCAARFP